MVNMAASGTCHICKYRLYIFPMVIVASVEHAQVLIIFPMMNVAVVKHLKISIILPMDNLDAMKLATVI